MNRRRWLAVGAVVAVVAASAWWWWWNPLRGLPDVGDPFPREELTELSVPDADNAFVLYRQAGGQMTHLRREVASFEWERADPELRNWLAVNQAALALWRKGTERPDALYIHPTAMRLDTIIPLVQDLREFGRLALLEAGRLEARGDMAGAWGWYRAALRSSRHLGRHGCLIERLVGIAMHKEAAERARRWAEDPRTDGQQLRTALAEVEAIDAMTVPLSEVLRTEYLMIVNTLEDPGASGGLAALAATVGQAPPASVTIWGRTFSWGDLRYNGARLALRREPEVSLRIVRLIFADWLAACDLPPDRQPPPADTPLFLYRLGPDAPPAARAITPEELDDRFRQAVIAPLLMPGLGDASPDHQRDRATLLWKPLVEERAAHRELVRTLAEQLRLREE